jgi:hypothetical protein
MHVQQGNYDCWRSRTYHVNAQHKACHQTSKVGSKELVCVCSSPGTRGLEGHPVEQVMGEVDGWVKGKHEDGVDVHGNWLETFRTLCSVS